MKHLTRIYTYLAILFAVMSAGCTSNNEVMQSVFEAERIAETQPEEALAIMQAVDRSAIRGSRDNARYALIYSEVLYYNRIYVDRDTLTRAMVEYYRDSDNHTERARALYQHSLVMKYSENVPEAMLSLIQAEESFAEIDNERLKGLIHRSKGDIYGNGCLFKNALDEYTTSKEYFDNIGLEEHSIFAQFDMGCVCLQMRDYAAAEQHLIAARDYAIANNNKIFLCEILHELCKSYIQNEEFQKCRETLTLFDTYDCLLYDLHRYYCSKAISAAVEGDKEEAEEMLAAASRCEDSVIEDIEYAHYIVNRCVGSSEIALEWHERSKNRQDNLMLEVLEQPVLNMQVEMLKTKLDSEKRERELIRQRNTITYVGIAILAVLAMVYIWYRIRKKNQDIAQYIETIAELQLVDRNLSTPMVESISALYRDRFNELNDLCDTYYDHSGTARQKNLVIDQLTHTIDAIKSDQRRLIEIEDSVNKYRDNLMHKLHEQLPRLSERDYRVALYSFAGFSNRAIALFIDSNPATVSKIKYSIKQKMRKIESDDSEVIQNALSEK